MSIDTIPNDQLLKDSIHNIINALTSKFYRYINRQLLEKYKIVFNLMVSLKILIKEGKLMPHDVQFMLKARSRSDDVRAK